MSGPGQAFRFAQFEFPWQLGPDPGRYVVRDPGEEDASHVLVIAAPEAPVRRRRRAARPKDAGAADGEPAAVAVARVTVIDARPVAGPEGGEAWLDAARRDPGPRVAAAVETLNRALHLHRIAAADPLAAEIASDLATVVRLGYGTGDQVAAGAWTAAVVVPPPPAGRRRRASALRPGERLAQFLAGRAAPLACEALALRTRLDLDRGREREAALQLRGAVAAALAELEPDRDVADLGARRDELARRQPAVEAAAAAAATGPLDAEQAAAVRESLERLEAALRARSAAGLL
ncbi:MAG: hypothetical protein U0R70_04890 [Solirubrobacteraceae bacterium]